MCQNPFCFNHHRNVEKTIQSRMRLAETVDGKQFLNAVANISIWKETPKYHPCDSKLFCAKYEERLKTFALNEVLGRPVPNVLNLHAIVAEARAGNFNRLDQTLGFTNNNGEELEVQPFKQQLKMNSIMENIVKTQGLDYDAIIMELMRAKYRQATRSSKEFRKEKKNKIRKMKLNNQRKLGAITNSISEKSARNEAEAPVNGRNDSSKTKTAKDFEHYRKSKRPTRI